MKTKILFICRYNRFRSKFAEAYFNKINTNDKIEAKSAGLFKGNKIDKGIYDLAKKHKLILTKKPQSISEKLLEWQDTIIIVADNVPEVIFNDHRVVSKQILNWNIKEKETSDVVLDIQGNVENLLSKFR